jgi:large repetitive protein
MIQQIYSRARALITPLLCLSLGVLQSCAQVASPGIAEPYLDVVVASMAAGLRNPDGTPHVTPPPHAVTGKTLNVTKFGADPADSATDDRPAIEAALNAATEGDEIYFPNGTYNLMTAASRNENANILLRSGVNLRGESGAGVVLISNFDTGTSSRAYTVIRGQDVSDVLVSNLSVSSTWNRKFPTNPRIQNPDRGGPLYAIALESNVGRNQRVTFESVIVERFARMGFRIGKGSSDVVIRRSTARNATDIGGGGAGYGFVMQGGGHLNSVENPYLGSKNDNYFNVVEECTAQGPYIRHGALIQFWAHNNVVRNSHFDQTIYDAIDLHGEDEYLNEIAHNTITRTSAGAGIGLGNSGATHDKTGPWNWIHHNTITSSMRGITVEYGTRANLIEDNTIQGNNSYFDQFGIGLGSVSDIVIRRNKIIDNKADGFAAFRFYMNRAEGEESEGSPAHNRIEANTIRGNAGLRARALKVESQGECNVFVNNAVSGNTDNTIATPDLASPLACKQKKTEIKRP